MKKKLLNDLVTETSAKVASSTSTDPYATEYGEPDMRLHGVRQKYERKLAGVHTDRLLTEWTLQNQGQSQNGPFI